MQMKTKMIALALLAATSTTYADETQWFEVSVQNASSQGNGDIILRPPHRSPANNEGIAGVYDCSTGTLSLCSSFDVACVRIYKDDTLIMEDTHPVTDDGTLYYNLSFYGSGAYRICLYDEDGNSYIGNYIY